MINEHSKLNLFLMKLSSLHDDDENDNASTHQKWWKWL